MAFASHRASSDSTEILGTEVSDGDTGRFADELSSSQPLPAGARCRREKSDFQKLLAYALKALARREHSTVELRRKLNSYLDRQIARSATSPANSPQASTDDFEESTARSVPMDPMDPIDAMAPLEPADRVIDRVVAALALDGSLSDERFASEFVRSRILKGYGPIRIRMDLLERGVPDRLAEDELTRPTEFWQRQAAEVCLRKFGDPQVGDSGSDDEVGDELVDGLRGRVRDSTMQPVTDQNFDDLEGGSPDQVRQLMKARKEAAQRRWNRCARFLSQRGFPADLIYRTLDGRLLD